MGCVASILTPWTKSLLNAWVQPVAAVDIDHKQMADRDSVATHCCRATEMTFDQCVDELRKKDSEAARWVERLSDQAGTTDSDWAVFEAAGEMLATLGKIIAEQDWGRYRQVVDQYEQLSAFVDTGIADDN